MAKVGASLWMRCPDCEDLYCRAHGMHRADCDCPALETLLKKGMDPYLPGSLKQYLQKYPQPRRKYES